MPLPPHRSTLFNYSWINTIYTFTWSSPTGTVTNTYTGQACTFSTGINELFGDDKNLTIYPNPAKTGFSLALSSPFNVNDIQNISIFDVKGSLVLKTHQYKDFIEIPHFTEGVYFVRIQFSNSQLTKKLVVH